MALRASDLVNCLQFLWKFIEHNLVVRSDYGSHGGILTLLNNRESTKKIIAWACDWYRLKGHIF